MADSDTLLIRHLPICLVKNEIEDFFKHVGAVKVTVHESKIKKHSSAFAKFKNKDVAKEVLLRLHQQTVLDSKLVVEFANSTEFSESEKKQQEENRDKKVEEESKKMQLRDAFIRNLNNWAIGLNFTLPPPSHLRYRYPAASAEVLVNIVNMLTSSTRFYTQVLHLMNKMNLPSPFEADFSLQENETFNSFIVYILENSVYEKDKAQDSETELESEEDEVRKDSVMPKKRTLSTKKIVKKQKLFKPLISANTPKVNKAAVDDVFEKVDREAGQKKIEVKIPTLITALDAPCGEAQLIEEKSEGFGVIYPKEKSEDKEKNDGENEQKNSDEKCITAEELTSNRISARDWNALPIFKNYKPGVPSCRLYIKNLSKHVTISDLNYIFKRYHVKGIDEQGIMFDIRLMQEGRMKGQAFVTLQSIKQAERALMETNGYIIKDKPMVVQYARSAAAKLDTDLM